MRLAIYGRVSTRQQSTDLQIESLRRYAQARGATEVSEFVDEGVSGAKAARPALSQLMISARRREFDAVAVTKLDRLARSMRHLTTAATELEALGIDLIVVDQGLDTSTPAGRLLFNMLGAIAEFERDLIRERVSAGLEAAKRKGKRIGRPSVVDRRLRERIVRLSNNGTKQREIVALTGCSKGTVHRVLSRDGVDHTNGQPA